MAPTTSQIQAVTDEIDRTAAAVRALTENSRSSTAEALGDIEQALRGITAEARRSISGVRAQVTLGAGHNDQTDISRAFDNQRKAAHTYVRTVDRLCDEQAELAGAAVEAVQQCSAIIEAGQTITTVSRASRLLSLNAATSAARIGARGAAVSVIAHQMQSLSDEIQGVNQELQHLVTRLMGLLPGVVEQAEAIRSAARGFSQDVEASNVQLAGETGALDRAIKTSVDGADARLRAIVRASGRALSELNFRSRFDDRLRSMGREGDALSSRVSLLAGRASTAGDR